MFDKRKPRQERATHADTKENLSQLKKYIRYKMQLNQCIMTEDEEDYVVSLLYDSILSHGSFRIMVPYPDGNGIMDFKNLGNFFETYCDGCAMAREYGTHNLPYIYIFDPTTNRKVKFNHSDIWAHILKGINKVKSHILEEGIHMSPEKEIREKPTTFKFSSEDFKKKD